MLSPLASGHARLEDSVHVGDQRYYWDAYQNQADATRVQNDLDEIVDINGRLQSLRDAITNLRKPYAEAGAREPSYWLDNSGALRQSGAGGAGENCRCQATKLSMERKDSASSRQLDFLEVRSHSIGI